MANNAASSKSPGNENPKRLEPTLKTKRSLFLLSGNRCAFPDCSRVIMDKDGNFVGEICHIEAAEPGGERFNANQTNEQRRDFSNLMLMCHEHHVVTNNTAAYSVSRLQEMKAAHEQKINDFLETMTCRIEDRTRSNAPTYPATLHRFSPGTVEEGWIDVLAVLRAEIDNLAKVPIGARKLFAIAIGRSRFSGTKLSVSLDDVQEACGLSLTEMQKFWMILDHHGLVEDASDWPGHNAGGITKLHRDWYFWDELKDFAENGGATLEEVIVDLNFKILD